MKFWSRFLASFRGKKVESDMAEEMRLHLEQRIDEYIAAGMSQEEANYAAQRKFGGVEQVKEIAREQRPGRWWDEFSRNVKHSVRSWGRNPAFVATIVLTLALGLGANVVVFAVFRGVLLKPLPFLESDRVVVTLNQYPRKDFGRVGSSVLNYFERKQGIAAFSDVAAVRFAPVNVGLAGLSERVPAGYVTSSFFHLLGIRPALGRFLSEGAEDSTGEHEVILSDAFWRRHFNADPSAIGRELRVHGVVATVVGVLPRGFHYPSADAQLWIPLTFTPAERSMSNRHSTSLDVIGRLRPKASLAEAQVQLDALNAQLAADDPHQTWATEAGFRTEVVTLQSDCAAAIRPALGLLQTGACFLLLIGIVNLFNLLLARVVTRTREFAVRRALGASDGRIAAQLWIETLALTSAGGLAGLGWGAVALRALAVFGGDRLPLASNVALDWPVVITAAGGALVIGAMAALVVVRCATHRGLPLALRVESLGGTTRRSVRQVRHALIIVQVALAFVLLAITNLLAASVGRVVAVKPGFQSDDVLTGVVFLPSVAYPTPAKRLMLVERLIADLRARSEITGVGISTALPFASIGGLVFTVDGSSGPPTEASSANYVALLGGNFFETLGIPLREGRYFTAADSYRRERVCVIDEAFARTHWPGRSPLGHHVFQGTVRDPSDAGATIVGVVGTVREGDPRTRPMMGKVYFPFTAEWTPSFLYLSIKTGPLPGVAPRRFLQS